MSKPYNYLYVAEDGVYGTGFSPEYPTTLANIDDRVGVISGAAVFEVFQTTLAAFSFYIKDATNVPQFVIVSQADPTGLDITNAILAAGGGSVTVNKLATGAFAIICITPPTESEGMIYADTNCTVEQRWFVGKNIVAVVKSDSYTLTEPVVLTGGDAGLNRPCLVIGYKETFDEEHCVSDLDKGEAFCESPIESYKLYKAEGDSTANVGGDYPKIGGSVDSFHIDLAENVRLKNLAFLTTKIAVYHSVTNYTADGEQVVEGCKFLDNECSFNTPHTTGTQAVIDCFCAESITASDYPLWFSPLASAQYVLGCVILRNPGVTLQEGVHMGGSVAGCISNNIIIGGGFSLRQVKGMVTNNLFYKPAFAVIETLNSNDISDAMFKGNICVGSDLIGTAIFYWKGTVSLMQEDHNWYYNMASLSSNKSADKDEIVLGSNSSWNVADPQISDVAGGDFGPLNTDVLRGGSVEIDGSFSVIGPMGKPERVTCWRQANLGRMSVVR